jgi:hypothetical protein
VAAEAALQGGAPNLAIASQCTSSTLRGSAQEEVRRLTRTELSRVLQTTFESLFGYEGDYPFGGFVYDFGDIMRDYPVD